MNAGRGEGWIANPLQDTNDVILDAPQTTLDINEARLFTPQAALSLMSQFPMKGKLCWPALIIR